MIIPIRYQLCINITVAHILLIDLVGSTPRSFDVVAKKRHEAIRLTVVALAEDYAIF